MEATTTRRHKTYPMSYYKDLVKDMDDSQKLQLITILAESINPSTKSAATNDEEYTLRPFTMDELNARLDQSEAEIAAGLGTSHEEVMREMDEEIERWEQEKLQHEVAQSL